MAMRHALLSKRMGCPVEVGDSVKINDFVYLVTESEVVCLGRQRPGCQGTQGIEPSIGESDGNSDGPIHRVD